MKVWLASFVLLFAAVEFVQWVKGLALPFPAFAVVGLALAAASNADKRAGFPFKLLDWLAADGSPVPPSVVGRSPSAPAGKARQGSGGDRAGRS